MMANGLPYPVSHLCSEGASKGILVPKDIMPAPYNPRSLSLWLGSTRLFVNEE